MATVNPQGRESGSAGTDVRKNGILYSFKGNMLSMAPEVSAGTSVEVLGGKEKIETPPPREFKPGGVLLPGLTSEALRDAKSPFRSGIG